MIGNQYKVYYKGLHKRPTYESLINYLHDGQETIKYPNRTAKQMRNHPYLTQLDGEGMDMMELQQLNAMKYMMSENALRNIASRPGGRGMPELRAVASGPSSSSSSSSSVMSGAGSASGMGYESVPDSEEWRHLYGRIRPTFLPRSSGSVSPPRVPTYVISPSPSIAGDAPGLEGFRLYEGSLEDASAMLAEKEQEDDEAKKQRLRDIKRIALEGLVDYGKKTAAEQIMMEQEAEPQLAQPASSSSAPAEQPHGDISGFLVDYEHYGLPSTLEAAGKLAAKINKDDLIFQSKLRGLSTTGTKNLLMFNILKFDSDPKNKGFKPSQAVLKSLTQSEIEQWKTSVGKIPK